MKKPRIILNRRGLKIFAATMETKLETMQHRLADGLRLEVGVDEIAVDKLAAHVFEHGSERLQEIAKFMEHVRTARIAMLAASFAVLEKKGPTNV